MLPTSEVSSQKFRELWVVVVTVTEPVGGLPDVAVYRMSVHVSQHRPHQPALVVMAKVVLATMFG